MASGPIPDAFTRPAISFFTVKQNQRDDAARRTVSLLGGDALHDLITKLAPTLASALLSPMAGVAVAGLCKIFGLDKGTISDVHAVIQSQGMSPEQLIAIRQLDDAMKQQEIELDFKYSDLVIRDVASARQREVATASSMNGVLASVIVSAFVIMTGMTLSGLVNVDTVLAGTLVGYLSAKCEQVLSYYFGSTRSSMIKTEMIASQSKERTP